MPSSWLGCSRRRLGPGCLSAQTHGSRPGGSVFPTQIWYGSSHMRRKKSNNPIRQEHTHRARPGRSLLPLPDAEVRRRSLVAHLALAVCRTGKGNKYQLCELARAAYSSYFMWKSGLGSAAVDTFIAAEEVLELAAEQADATGIWSLAANPLVERVICLYDEQLAAVTSAVFYDCEKQVALAICGILTHRGMSCPT